PRITSRLDVGRVAVRDRIVVLEALDGSRVLALDADGDVILAAGELRLLGAHGLQEGLVLQRLAADLRSVHVVIEHRLRDVLNFLNGERHFGNPSRTTRSWR